MDIENKSFDKLVDMWVDNSTLEKHCDALCDIYTNDEKLADLKVVEKIRYRQAVYSMFGVFNYADFLNKHSSLSVYDKGVYLKVLYAYAITDDTWDGFLINDPNYKDMLPLLKRKSSATYIPMEELTSACDDEPTSEETLSEESQNEEIPSEEVYILEGYERRWREKAIKNREKATKLAKKYERIKAEKILLKNIEKYGDAKSIEQLAFLYKDRVLPELAFKYFEMAKNLGYKESAKMYAEYKNLKKSNDSVKVSNDYIDKCNEYMDLANQSTNSKQELKYLNEVFKLSPTWSNVPFRIAKILLESGSECFNVELGKKFLDYYLKTIVVVERSNKYDEFFAFYAKLLNLGTIIKKDKSLAYFCYCCVKNKSEDLKAIFEPYKERELNRTFEELKERFVKDSQEDRLKTIALQQAENEKVQKENEKIQREKDLYEESKNLTNIFNLDRDYTDFDFQRRNESEKDYKKKLELFKSAHEKQEEKEIVDTLIKAGKLGHTKAMVALFHYYLSKENYDKAYHWVFNALDDIESLKVQRKLYEVIPVKVDYLLKFIDEHNSYSCEKFVAEKLDYLIDIDDTSLNMFVSYANKGNYFAKSYLYDYYSVRDNDKIIDLLYDLAEDVESKYVDLLIREVGKLEAEFDDKFVKFLLNPKHTKNKYIKYQLARLYSDENLCEKFNLTYNPTLAYETLCSAIKCSDGNYDGLKKEIDFCFINFYENGIGTNIDYKKVGQFYMDYDSVKAQKFILIGDYVSASFYGLKQLNKIKECLLSLDVDDLKVVMQEIKRFNVAGFSMGQVFDIEGNYIGRDILDMLVKKEKEIEEERLRQERLRKEREERERLEKLKREQEERERLERLRKEEEEKARLEKLRQEQERLIKLQKEQEEKERKATYNIQNRQIESGNKQQFNTNSNSDSGNVATSNVTPKVDSQNGPTIQQIRQKYNCPVMPVRPDKDYNDGLSYKQRVKLYGPIYKEQIAEYDRKLKAYDKELESYTNRLQDVYNRIIDNLSWGEVCDKLQIAYGVSSDRFMDLDCFLGEVYKMLRNSLMSDVDVSIRNTPTIFKDYHLYYEKLLALKPIYIESLTLDIRIGTYSSDIRSFVGREQYTYNKIMQAFEESPLSKLGTWAEFSSTTTEIGVMLSENYKNEQVEDYQKGAKIVKTIARNIVSAMVNKYKIIYRANYSFFMAVKDIKINFQLPGAYK